MKLTRCIAGLSLLAVLASCGESGPALTATDIQIIAPAPGRSASVAYMTIENNGGAAELTSVSSPFFSRVELHETALSEGVARMQRIDGVEIAAGETLLLAPGGRHIMLFDPTSAPLPGKNVRLQLEFSTGEMLIVEAPLATRIDVQ